MGFVKFPSKWIRDEGLHGFRGGDGVLELKTLFALTIANGALQRRLQRPKESFPASLDVLSDLAHVARPHAVRGVDLLLKRGLIKRVLGDWRAAGVGHRSSFFSFTSPPTPFLKFPAELVRDSHLLSHARLRNRRSLAALQLYLLLGAFRENESGVSRLGYDAMERYGVVRDTIKAGLDLLITAGLVGLHRPNEMGHTYMYNLLGLERPRSRTAAAAGPREWSL